MDSAGSPRDRYHAQVRSEVLAAAWDELSDSGHAALSVKAVATRMHMTAPALYRYIGSRDELLTDLAARAAEELAEAVRHGADADADADDGSSAARLVAVALQVRRWADTNPHAYRLVYGQDDDAAASLAVQVAERSALAAIEQICAIPEPTRRPRPGSGRPASRADAARQRAACFWTRMHGVIGLELAGRLDILGIDAITQLTQEATLAAAS